MTDFVQYLVDQVANKKLSKCDAISLLRQFEAGRCSKIVSELHPLLHHNTSTLSEQRFSSTLVGNEFFLADHVVNGQRVLPGVAYLEMARAAFAKASDVNHDDQSVGIKLQNVVWASPIVVGDEVKTIHIGLYPEDDGAVAYEIYSEPADPERDATIHGQGRLSLSSAAIAEVLDLNRLREQCTRGQLSAERCYAAFRQIGLTYGPAFQGVETVFVGDGQALARLNLPAAVLGTSDDFVLHPGLMDSALQSSIGLFLATAGGEQLKAKLALPFALDELTVLYPCNSDMWAFVRYSSGRGPDKKLQRLDVDLCDDNGRVCVQFKGFTSRVLEGSLEGSVGETGNGSLMVQPYWREQPVASVLPESVTDQPAVWGEYRVILCEPVEGLHAYLDTQLSLAQCFDLSGGSNAIEARYNTATAQVFEQLQVILRRKPKAPVLVQILLSYEFASIVGEESLYAGLFGLLATAHQENPNLIGQLIEVEAETTNASIVERLVENSRLPVPQRICYRNGTRWVADWREVAGFSVEKENNVGAPWKEGGLYLITGGAGGLGLLFAEDIAKKAKGARIILTGRSPLSEEKVARLQALQANGAVIDYRLVDIADRQSTTDLIQSLKDEYGGLNGILHSAGVIRDNFILNKTLEELQAVLTPKVAGLVNLDWASRELDLDFLVVFSSMAGALGNVGQADYAAANAFMDAYVHYRNALVSTGQRKCKTVSINWPLWKEGGMHVDAESERVMTENTGMVAMRSETGLCAFYQAVAQEGGQWMVMEGDLNRMRQAMLDPLNLNVVAARSVSIPNEKEKESSSVPAIAEDILKEKVVGYLKRLLSSVIKLPSHRIEADTPLEQYGIDSIMVVQLTNQLEKTFGSLPKTLFFEYQNIEELSGYFLEFYAEQLNGLLGIEKNNGKGIHDEKSSQIESSLSDNSARVTSQPVISANSRRQRQRFSQPWVETQQSRINSRVDVAIIGLSGRYPQANTVEEFWINLRDGKDCITEIPEGRWDHSLYFDEDKNKPGKTYSKWGGFIQNVDKFDPLYFNISPREAEIIDPQERLFLQCAIETIQDAGYTRNTLGKGDGVASNVGVYVGVMYEEYQLFGAQETLQGHPIALSGSAASIANRVSYFCNFHGPSMALDTMCSSSLTAIHLACQSLYREECELAIAGGVNVSIHPNKYLMLGQGKFVSSKGHCESFGVGGDGYVPGEGVGAVLLKPLSQAEMDGDHIYGVIKGTAVNHGGKTNGYSVPNPNAQGEVIERALRESDTDPRTISYIEAHGTGTSLGDPIEIAGLTKAFKAATQDKQFCAIGSAKSNIGHCESAAGIAGVTKVLLQLRHKQLVPSLHSAVLNPNIDFNATPFVVQQTLVDWERPVVQVNGQEKEYPRIAGISSFGAGGANAHIIIQEYRGEEREQTQSSDQPLLIVLSAKSPAQLMESVRALYGYLEKNPTINQVDLAYTLQVGREAMEERLAMQVGSLEELMEKLKAYQENKGRSDDIENLYKGKAKQNKETLSVFSADKELQEAVDKWIQRGKYAKLLDLWVKGLDIDWAKIYGGSRPKRISLPTYPFERTRYWVETGNEEWTVKSGEQRSNLHPLLHRNTSTLFEQRFSSTFDGQETFLAGRQVDSRCVLPGIAYLEMARVAVLQAIEMNNVKPIGLLIKDVTWMNPIIVDKQAVTVSTGLYLADSIVDDNTTHIDFEIFSKQDGLEDDLVIHGQGQVIINEPQMASVLDLDQLRSQCESQFSRERCYKVLNKINLEFGKLHSAVQAISIGKGQAIAKLSLPEHNGTDEYVLHPSMLDSSIQAATVFLLANSDVIEGDFESPQMILPSALDELQVLNSCLDNMWAWIRYADDHSANNRLDIDLCDDKGNLHVRLKGLTLRNQELNIETDAYSTLMLRPEWVEKSVNSQGHLPEYGQHLVILCEVEDELCEQIEGSIKGVNCLNLRCEESSVNVRFETYSEKVFEQVKTLLGTKPKDPILIQVVIQCDADRADERQLLAGLYGLLTTAYRENPKLIGQVVDIGSVANNNVLMTELLIENRYEVTLRYIRYRNGKRWVREWHEIQTSEYDYGRNLSWRDNGVYLITGGAGGLGLIFAKDIAQKVKSATLILTGRSSLNEAKTAQLKALETLAGDSARVTVDYCQVDVSNREAIAYLIEKILDKFGVLNGIIHSAGVTRDSYIINKTKSELHDVLAPKVTGLVNLDLASRVVNLDFLVMFSSASGVLGNVGQADYATANAFMDSYAHYRNQLVSLGERSGRTVSINWPLWKEGGMHVDTQTERLMEQNTGMVVLPTEKGINAFYQGAAAGADQWMVIEGLASKVREKVLGVSQSKDITLSDDSDNLVPVNTCIIEGVDTERLRKKTLYSLSRLFGEVVKLDVDKIEQDESWENYGVESVMIMQLNNQLAEIFGEVSKTLFFEYQNLSELTDYFLSEYQQTCLRWTGMDVAAQPKTSMERTKTAVIDKSVTYSNATVGTRKSGNSSRARAAVRRFATASDTKNADNAKWPNPNKKPIAIIGISGHYPQAKNLEEYWQNLASGKSCITEIPPERWPLDGFFIDDLQTAIDQGKSYSKWGGFLEGFSDFDPLFFKMSPREAMIMDPQERLFLQSCWEVLEDAGYQKEQLEEKYNGRVGVFVGITKTGHELYGHDSWKHGSPVYPHTSFSSVANRISYFLNLQGPSMPIDTMCSSSLVAIHEACNRLLQQECEMAIAGGVNLYLHPSSYIKLCAGRLISNTEICAAFGEKGNGFVPGEGVGCVLLKPLSLAERDRDHIYAVILGSHSNHNGKTSGYMVPSPIAQYNLALENFQKSGVDPRTISYVESAANGSSLGDPIEFNALTKAFLKLTNDKDFCAIGSVKPNIGHLEAASGISQLTKVILQLQYQQLVPSIHTEPLNSNLSFNNTPFYLQRELREWKRPIIKLNSDAQEFPRRATVSSFGAGGVNAHLIIEEYIEAVDRTVTGSSSKKEMVQIDSTTIPEIAVLSAKNDDRLHALIGKMINFLEFRKFSDVQNLSLPNIAYTLQVGREEMDARIALVVNNIEELIQGLKDYLLSVENGKNIESHIPIFKGYLGEYDSKFRNIFSGSVGDAMLKIILEEKNIEKIALLWTLGNEIPWKSLHDLEEVQKISLPTYAFKEKSYWIVEELKKNGVLDSLFEIEVGGRSSDSVGLKQELQEILSEYKTNKNSLESTSDRIRKVFS